jgi:hypothetical protein
MTRWLTGHCYLARHQPIINNQIDPTSFLCQEAEETPWHLLTECHATLDLRLKELSPEPWEVTSILKCINKLIFLEVVDYNDVPQQF